MQNDPLKIKIVSFTLEKLELSLYSTSENNEAELDFYSVDFLEQQLIDIIKNYEKRLPGCITLSLKPIRFIDSEGLFFCVQMHTLLQKKGSKFVLNHVHSNVLRSFKITGLDQKILIKSKID
jgi:anti-anti-sigma factor